MTTALIGPPLVAYLVGLPLVFALLMLFAKGEGVKRVAFIASLVELGLALFAYYTLHKNSLSPQLSMDVPWITSLGVDFNVAIDGISMVLVLLTTILVPIIILSSFRNNYENPSTFYALIMFMQMALIGVFVARDGFLFYIFWELALIPIYFICLMWGGENRGKITFKFFVYTLTGSLFMLAALIYLYLNTSIGDTNIHTFDLKALYLAGQKLLPTEQTWVFWGLFLGFAIKMPIFPFHTWQPDTYVTAPTQGTMLLSGIMLKMGTYGIIRWLLPMTPAAWASWGTTALLLCVISIIYASCMALVQKDFKRLIAYSSIAHVGLIAAGVFAFSPDKNNVEGITGAVVQMFSHGINVVGLFFIADILLSRTGTRELDKLGGIRNVSPQFTTLFMIIMLGSVALPLTNGFVGEFLLINGVYQFSATMALFAGLTIILGAVYMLRSFQAIMLGNTKTITASFGELSGNEKTVLLVVCAAVIILGVYPAPLISIIQNDVHQLVSGIMPMHS
ncbi:MAG TPA: NADH-quinone oxidoreductase subunit M [Bacteroidia bacterium]|nr:NADH-quinone oxidoreductase subunit M [Bacteroidia bacterium]